MFLDRLERCGEELLSAQKFYRRLVIFGLLSMAIILVSLCIGIAGYITLEGMRPVDAFLNAAMLMGGMGPVGPVTTDGGKIFAGLYAMYCGFVLIFSVALFMTPIFHRVLHVFHLEGKQ